jgi:hypothetical protein
LRYGKLSQPFERFNDFSDICSTFQEQSSEVQLELVDGRVCESLAIDRGGL